MSSLRTVIFLFVLVVLGLPETGRRVHAQQEEPGSPRRQSQLTILQINDVYSTVPINGAGGLARVATLKQRLSENGHPVLMLLADDFQIGRASCRERVF